MTFREDLTIELHCENPACPSCGDPKEIAVYQEADTGAWSFVNPMDECCKDCGGQLINDYP